MTDRSALPRILVVDDEPVVRDSIRRILAEGHEVVEAANGHEALEKARAGGDRPDLILLDVRMPGIDGYEVCARLQGIPDLCNVPVIFVTALDSDQDRERAFAVGAVEYVEKPFEREALLEVIRTHLDRGREWREIRSDRPRRRSWLLPSTFAAFRQHLVGVVQASEAQEEACAAVGPKDFYAMALILRISTDQLARYLARFLDLPFVDRVQPEELGLGVLPRAFCEANAVLPMADRSVAVANPFDWELMETLERSVWKHGESRVVIADPDRIRGLCRGGTPTAPVSGMMEMQTISLEPDTNVHAAPSTEDALAAVNRILRDAIAEEASDIHLEPKTDHTLVRFRLDGEMHDIRKVDPTVAMRAISRLKALAGMDIAERRKPQDGALLANLGKREFKLRLATSSTTRGETLVIRLLEPRAAAVPLDKLGMTAKQSQALRSLADRHQGMILVVGSTGSGKSTTIFTLLSAVDGRSRSIMSVEDPVEYRIPYANQQQVREQAGVTFEALLRSAMRQDPDILFLGEIRDPYSARAALDFASSGHLTVSTLHSSNATTAIFRLERLGVERTTMSDSITAIVAQKLLRKLCEHCREIGPPTESEAEKLLPFTGKVPEKVARPRGCPACRETGYRGREGVFEVLHFDPEVAHMVREGAPIANIRRFCAERGDYLVVRHALDKVRKGIFSIQDVHEHILLEEMMVLGKTDSRSGPPPPSGSRVEPPPPVVGASETSVEPPSPAGTGATSILAVDDDPDIRALVKLHLEGGGFQVESAEDGIEALMALGRGRFDLVLSDINMPNLDGLKLMEMINQKGIVVPTIFLTGEEDDALEARMLSLGAADFIRKPIHKDALLIRVKRALRSAPVGGGIA